MISELTLELESNFQGKEGVKGLFASARAGVDLQLDGRSPWHHPRQPPSWRKKKKEDAERRKTPPFQGAAERLGGGRMRGCSESQVAQL